MQELTDFQRYAEAVNAERYRVICFKMDEDDGEKVLVLDKKDGMARGFSPHELKAHLPEMLRLQRQGKSIRYTPLSDARHHILVGGMTRDSVIKFQEDGFRPAVILESSPGSYQCLLTIPKLGTAFDQDVGNRITERLNREYGDPTLSGIHPHCAPGFENRQPEQRRGDGGYPQVKLLFAERRECGKALTLARWIDHEYAEAAEKRKAERQALQKPGFQPGDPARAYYAHLDAVRSHLSIDDSSRVDAMIALRMRANGHSREAVAEAIQACAPTIRDSRAQWRNWQRYAERTADYAFGIAGDMDLMRNERFRDMWRRAEGVKEEKEWHRVRLQ